MKRSRTCHCLVELDDTPKRTRSSPNLDSLRRCLIKALQHQQQQQQQQQQSKHERSVFANQGKQNFDLASAFRLLQRSPTPAEGGAAEPSNPTLLAGMKSSPMDGNGKGRSKSLNELPILEHGQFSGDSDDYFVGTEDLRIASTSTLRDSLHDGDYGHLFEDPGDLSDYFYGVASSDEADDDTALIPIGVGLDGCSLRAGGGADINGEDIGGRYPSFGTSDTDSTGQSDGHISDSGVTAWSEDTATLSAAEGDSVRPPSSASYLTWAKSRGGALNSTPHGYTDRHDDSCGGASGGPAYGVQWQPSRPKFNVMTTSPGGVAFAKNGIGILSSSLQPAAAYCGALDDCRERQQHPAKVSPPWPAYSSVSSSHHGRLTTPRRGETDASDDVGLVYSVASGMDRLRLVEPKPKLPPVVEVGPDPVWNNWDIEGPFENAALKSAYPRSEKA